MKSEYEIDEIRQMTEMRKKGFTWQQITAKLGYYCTPDAIKKRYYRYNKKKKANYE